MTFHKVDVWYLTRYLTSLSYSFFSCRKEIKYRVVLGIERENIGGKSVIYYYTLRSFHSNV